MIRRYQVRFRTNRDGFPGDGWPQEFGESMLPRIGEHVEHKNEKELRVCTITHSEKTDGGSVIHVVEIELT